MMKNIIYGLGAAVVFLFVAVTGCVMPDRVNMLENRIAALEMENTRQARKDKSTVDQLNRVEKAVRENTKKIKENNASIKAEMHNLKLQIRQLRGVIEESGHKLETLSEKKMQEKEEKIERLGRKIRENKQKITALEEYMGFEPTAEGKENSPKEKEELDTPEALYKMAKSHFDNQKFQQARKTFDKFLNKYPKSDKADNARFWIADTYYREQWYEKAILEYQKVIEEYSKGNKVQAALLKQGYSFFELGENANATLILNELIKKYPDSKEAKIAEKKLEGLD
ncbi:MAG: tol-pal system protein YbgF [Desulfarculaceae bacterium]|nr:tol-pal system protein YbgF [Desulfarculaceae bacterium]